MYIKICKGDAINLNFKILEYKIPDFDVLAGNKVNEVEEVINLIAECGYPFKIIGLSEKERNYLVKYFHDYFTETDADYGILAKCLDIPYKYEWYVTSENDNVEHIADYLEHEKSMVIWAEKCIEFLEEKES